MRYFTDAELEKMMTAAIKGNAGMADIVANLDDDDDAAYDRLYEQRRVDSALADIMVADLRRTRDTV